MCRLVLGLARMWSTFDSAETTRERRGGKYLKEGHPLWNHQELNQKPTFDVFYPDTIRSSQSRQSESSLRWVI